MADNEDDERFRDRVVSIPERKRKRKLVKFEAVKVRTPNDYLIKGMIPRVGLAVVWGPPKCGKSFWVFDLVMHIALGRTYRGHRVKQGGVVYAALEGEHGFVKRVDAARRHFAVDEVPFWLMSEPLDLIADSREFIGDIKAQCPDPAVIVIDTLNRSLVGSENKDEDMARYIKAAEQLRIAFACVVVIVHHCGIDGSRPRGHSSLGAAVDTQIAVRRDGAGHVVAQVEFNKDGTYGETLTNRLQVVELVLDEDGEPKTSCVVVPVVGIGEQAKRRVKLTPRAQVALRLFADCVNEHGDYKTSLGGRVRHGTGTVPLELARQYFYDGTAGESDKRDTQKKWFQRVIAELQAAHRIGIWRDHLWIAGHRDSAGTGQET